MKCVFTDFLLLDKRQKPAFLPVSCYEGFSIAQSACRIANLGSSAVYAS